MERKYYDELYWLCFNREEVESGKNIFQLLRLKNWEIWLVEVHFRRMNAKRVLITHTDEECVFPAADGSAKLSVISYEFQEPTLRREYTARRENFSGESHGDGKEFQPEETKNDERINKDFMSIQRDFIYRHHIEPRS